MRRFWLILLSIFSFFLFLFPANSLDLGWHLKYGEYFWRHKEILRENIFSSTFPDYEWVNHSWLFDVVNYPIFMKFGFGGLSVAGAFLAGITVFLIGMRIRQITLTKLLIGMGFGYILLEPLFAHGLRAQLFSLVVFALVIFWAESTKKVKPAQALLMCILFVLSSNLHGQFMVSLGYLGLLFFAKLLDWRVSKNGAREVHELAPLWMMLIAGLVGSLVNPYGIESHLESFRYLTYPHLNLIAEWSPWILGSFEWWVLVIYSIYLGWKVWSAGERRLAVWLPLLFFAFQAFTRRRMIPFYAVYSLPYFLSVFKMPQFFLKIDRLPQQHQVALSLGLGILTLGLLLPPRKMMLRSWDEYCQSTISLRCSEGAANYLRNNPISGKVFNYYNWGGYFIYRSPGQKLFIDGRMTMWIKDGYSPLERYDQIYYSRPKMKEYWQEERFDAAIIQSNIPLENYLASELGWRTAYRDRNVVVLLKP